MENVNKIAVKDWDQETVNMMHKLKRYVTQLQTEIPRDGLNRPLALVNTQELMSTGLAVPLDNLLEERPPHLFLPISYQDGIPTVFGIPVWEKMEFEPTEYYDLFKIYRTLMTKIGTRSVHKVSTQTGISPRLLEIIRQAYFWSFRVEAFDKFREEEREQIQKIYRNDLEEKHRKTANELFNISTQYLTENASLLTPTTALKWAELAVRLSRLSVGLHPDKPGSAKEEDTPTVNIVNAINTNGDHGTAATGDVEEDRQRLKQLLNVMSNIGLFEQERETIIEGEGVVVDESDTD